MEVLVVKVLQYDVLEYYVVLEDQFGQTPFVARLTTSIVGTRKIITNTGVLVLQYVLNHNRIILQQKGIRVLSIIQAQSTVICILVETGFVFLCPALVC